MLKERNCNSTIKPLTSKTGVSAANFYYDETSVPEAVSGTNIAVYATKGRVSHWTTTNSGGTVLTEGIYSYDSTGRTQNFWQCTPLDCPTATATSIAKTSYTYDLAGDVTDYYPPPSYHLSYSINAARQVTAVTQNTAGWIDTTARPATLVQGITYTPFGAVDTFTGGCVPVGTCTPLQEKHNYNNRLQSTLIQVGTASSPNTVACDEYFYYSGFSNPSSCPSSAPGSGTSNNGNVMGWYHWDGDPWSPGSGVLNTTNYTYDALNRLNQASVASHYTQNYNNDRYGNMACASGSNYCNTTITFDTATNHISTSNYQYDSAERVPQGLPLMLAQRPTTRASPGRAAS